jgi:GAF domain
MPEPTNVSALARSAESPTALRTREPEPEIRLTNPTKASEAAGFNMRSSRETGGAGRFPLQTAFGLLLGIAVGLESIKQVLVRSIARNQSRIVIEDIAKDSRFAGLRLSENGIQFCAREPLLNRNGKPMGSLLVLDTRTRRMGAQEEELLNAAAIATMEALEVRAVSPRPES